MKPKSTSRSLILAGVFLSAGHSFAADGTWTANADGDWGDIANWNSGAGPIADGTGSSAFLSNVINGNRIINLDGPRIIGNIYAQDTSHNYTISGANTLTLDSGGIPVIDVVTNRTLTISSQISGSDGLQKSGAGILTLSGANDYTGGTVINGGRLSVNADARLGNAAGSITFNGGELNVAASFSSARAVLLNSFAGNQVLLQGNATWTNTGAVTGTGGITFKITGNGGVTANLNSAANSFTGILGIDHTSGSNVTVTTSSLADSASLGAGNIVFSGESGNGGRTFRWNGSSTLTLDNRQIELGAIAGTVSNNTTNAIAINTDLVATGAVAKTLTLDAVASSSNEFAGLLSDGTGGGSVALTKSGDGTWTLTDANNSYTGQTQIQRGTLSAGSLDDYGNNSSIGAAASGPILIGSGNNTGTLLYTGGAQSTNRNIQINSSNNTDAGGAKIVNDGSGALTFTASTFNETYTMTAIKTRVLTLDGTNGGDIQGTIQDNSVTGLVAVTKTGAGTWVLDGDNTYTGNTTVSNGSLIINGSTTSTSLVSVASGATLGGNGIVGGNTTISGNLSPGESPGTLTFANNLTLNNGATYNFEGGDLTAVSQTLDLNNNWTLALGSGFQDGGQVLIFTYGTLAADPDLDPTFNIANLGFTPSGSLSLTDDTMGNIYLNGVSVIPEPSAALLGGLGALLLLRRRRA